jgi:hypothetical protein
MFSEVLEVLTAPIIMAIALMMEAAGTSETLSTHTTLHGATTQKRGILILWVLYFFCHGDSVKKNDIGGVSSTNWEVVSA